LSASRLSQHEIFENKISFATRKSSAAGSTVYLAVNRLRSGFVFDDIIERIAVRARKGNVQRSPVASHVRLPVKFDATPTSA
jgi:hypothetical protein